jgi:hypothetical protein
LMDSVLGLNRSACRWNKALIKGRKEMRAGICAVNAE